MAKNPDRRQLPFNEQIAFFLRKFKIPTERWDDLLGAAHDRAFVVAGAAKADLLADLFAAVAMTIKQGNSIQWFRDAFDTIVAQYGWDYQGERNRRTRIIYTTNLSTSYAAGRWRQLTDPDLSRLKPFWMYKHADHVLQPRPLHVDWDGVTRPAGDPWFHARFPPNGWGCHCRVVAVSEREALAQGARWRPPDDGEYTYTDRNGNTHRLPNGVDYGWDYAPGENELARLEQLLDAKLERLFGELEPLAIKHDIQSFEDIGPLLRELSQQQPRLIPEFKTLQIMDRGDFDFGSDGNGNFWIASQSPQAQALVTALKKIRLGRPLTAPEEDAIAGLWHEIGHERQRDSQSLLNLPDTDPRVVLMETVNELISRHGYNEFLTALGGKARHGADILKKATGYQGRVERFRRLLDALGVAEQALLPTLEKFNFTQSLNRLGANLARHLAPEGVDAAPIQHALTVLGDADAFAQTLRQLKAARE